MIGAAVLVGWIATGKAFEAVAKRLGRDEDKKRV